LYWANKVTSSEGKKTVRGTRRARPLLGVFVSIEADGALSADAVEAAFAEIARVHRLMSFHERESDVSRANREARAAPVQVDPSTVEVLRFAQDLSRRSDGVFDVTVAPILVRSGALPRPEGAPEPDVRATWRDIEIDAASSTVRFARPLWIDLGGIAKGYAVDSAIEVLRRRGMKAGCVNAGGDVRAFGESQTILLRAPWPDRAPVVTLEEGALASSAAGEGAPVHFDDRREPARACDFATVLAPTCMAADALTKLVLAEGAAAEPLLKRYGAHAILRGPAGWTRLGAP
jgi:thiamine biosynthesis lipoprotein